MINDVTAGEKPNELVEDNVIGGEKEEKVPEAADEVSEGAPVKRLHWRRRSKRRSSVS